MAVAVVAVAALAAVVAVVGVAVVKFDSDTHPSLRVRTETVAALAPNRSDYPNCLAFHSFLEDFLQVLLELVVSMKNLMTSKIRRI